MQCAAGNTVTQRPSTATYGHLAIAVPRWHECGRSGREDCARSLWATSGHVPVTPDSIALVVARSEHCAERRYHSKQHSAAMASSALKK